MTGGQKFRRSERLRGKICIEALFEKGRSFSNNNLRIVYIEHALQGPNQSKIGVSVSKKFFKRAVDRNRIKRLLRTSYRLNKTILKKRKNKSYHIMFIYTSKTLACFDEINEVMKKILHRLCEKEA
ncbi:MAG: ribonuclease P protein component [Flavobacteriales bacterium AspAUS03]